MSRLIGRRGSSENGWTWLVVPDGRPPRRRRPPWRLLLASAAALAAFAALGAGLAVWLASSGGEGPADALPVVQSPMATTPAPGGAFPVPEGPGPFFRLAAWSDVEGAWKTGALPAAASGYREGDAVPFMLRIDKAQPGATYPLTIRYLCLEGQAHAFDYLSGYQPPVDGPQPALAPGGPGRAPPDSATAIGDDATIPYDDSQAARAFAVWGGTVPDASGPLPQTACGQEGPRDRVYILGITATRETAYLLWGAHLASAGDWGAGGGASSSAMPLAVQIEVHGLATVSISFDVGAVRP